MNPRSPRLQSLCSGSNESRGAVAHALCSPAFHSMAGLTKSPQQSFLLRPSRGLRILLNLAPKQSLPIELRQQERKCFGNPHAKPHTESLSPSISAQPPPRQAMPARLVHISAREQQASVYTLVEHGIHSHSNSRSAWLLMPLRLQPPQDLSYPKAGVRIHSGPGSDYQSQAA